MIFGPKKNAKRFLNQSLFLQTFGPMNLKGSFGTFYQKGSLEKVSSKMITATELHKYLPKTDCKKCSESSCMAFAIKLLDHTKNVSECPELKRNDSEKISRLLLPPIREVTIGTEESSIKIGGEYVMYRHQFKFFNKTAIMLRIDDSLNDDEIDRRINFVKNFRIERMGNMMNLNGIVVRHSSNDKSRFGSAVERIVNEFHGPIVLYSFDPESMDIGLQKSKKRRLLIFGANEKNFNEMTKLAIDSDCPVVVHSTDMDKFKKLLKIISKKIEDIVLSPCIDVRWNNFSDILDKFTMIRKSAVQNGEFGYPLMASLDLESNFDESLMAISLIERFASLLIINSTETWSLLPILMFRDNIYSDPRSKPVVEPKVYSIGNPDENSPVMVTTNFASTFYNVVGDLEKAKISCYLLAIDTKGFAVLVSLAAGIFTASLVKKSLDDSKIGDKVRHRRLILPGFASSVATQLKELSGWEILVGPNDSSQLGEFIRENF